MPYSERFTIHTTIRRNCIGLGSSPRASHPSSTARRMPISAPPAVQAGVVYPATPEAEVSGGSGIVLVNTTLPTALRHLTPHPGLIMFIVQMPPPIYPDTSPLICFARPCSGAGKLEDFSRQKLLGSSTAFLGHLYLFDTKYAASPLCGVLGFKLLFC